MKPTGWIAFRAILALTLMVGFYLFACAVAFALLLVPYAEFVYANRFLRISPRLFLGVAAVCIGAAGAILWSLVPRRDRFEPPGPRLTADSQPKLFAVLQSVADAAGQSLPRDVYLIGDVNAWVSHRGGVMGFGSHRVMGLGLPLLQLITVSELKAIIAHEFGHYSAGDVALGPWIYKTRAAIARTLQTLSGTLFQWVFEDYARMFLRVSSAVSRHQEYLADRLAARVCGAGPLISGLRKVGDGAPAFQWYFASEVVPVLNAGCVPPILAGFESYLLEPRRVEAPAAPTQAASLATEAYTYDTHPRLEERIQALKEFHTAASVDESGSSLDLLGDSISFERAVLVPSAAAQRQPLRPIAWSSVAMEVYLPRWLGLLEHHGHHLGAVRLEDLPATVTDAIPLAMDLQEAGEGFVPGDELARRLAWIVAAAVCVALVRKGWTLNTAPGRGFRVSYGELEYAPFAEVEAVIFGRIQPAGWLEFCGKAGLTGRVRELVTLQSAS